MIELAKHIEVLLLENDCVIVPGLGGFIAHRQQAVISPTGEFQPPRRTIGFNPQLVMNDGLLVQSYMQAYNTDFPDATRRIEKVVTEMKDQLYQQGQVTLPHVGTIYYNMNGGYTFEPASSSFFTPGLYGLENFTLPALKALPATEPKEYKLPEISRPASGKKRHFSLRHFTRNVVAIAAAVCLFFVLSVPVENTYMDDANYASLGSFSMFDAIRNQSVATSIQTKTTSQTAPQKKVQKQKKAQRVRNNVNTLKPVVVKTEKIAAAPAAQKETQPAVKKPAPAQPAATPAPATATGKKKAYIIVASLTTHNDAQQEVKRLQKQGYPNCKILETDGRFRVALDGYANSGEAYKKVQELRNQEEFKSAWVFTSK
ncbi:SPOR domain-containing protein [uncultured Bacteroides sp.]|uniref:HU domain-containing protein n=1 Tax=uncultured Bacteroides sp. TaxID=162156 RepID=UPI00280BD386|nr:SPOR domain-containing protein [uncultured Bacteroides sp.]